jgi:hypothetical protein
MAFRRLGLVASPIGKRNSAMQQTKRGDFGAYRRMEKSRQFH